MKTFKPTAAIALAIALTLVIGCSKHAVPQGPAPSVEFKTLNHATPVALHSVGKPLLVNFWSTSCGICIREMPSLSALYEANQTAGFEMVAVAMPYDRPSDVVQLSEGLGWPFLIALDVEGTLLEAFGPIKGTPTSFLIDADGQIVEKIVGSVKIDRIQKQLDVLHAQS